MISIFHIPTRRIVEASRLDIAFTNESPEGNLKDVYASREESASPFSTTSNMTCKARKIQDVSSDDDDAPEVVSHSTSKADAKRNQKVRHAFEAEEQARRKARNRERDQKLKERAHATRAGKTRGVRFVAGEDGGDSGEDDVEARMVRAMRDAAEEVGEDDDDDSDGEFEGFGQGIDLGDDASASSSDSFSVQDEDADMFLEENDSIDPDDEEDEETTAHQTNIQRSGRKADYLADDLFAAAFASQNSKPPPKKNTKSIPQQTVKKRRRKSAAHPKDQVVDGRTIRMLPRLSDPRSQATARSVPSARTRRFVDHSLAMKGKQALLKAKKKGWERRPANVGVMKCQGPPHGFARSTR